MDVTSFLNFIGSKLEKSNVGSDDLSGRSIKLLNTFKDCGYKTADDVLKLWITLCSEVHGFPWSGSSVKVYSQFLDPKHVCVIEELAKNLGLDVDKEI
jgi:hypothetical protein